MGLALLALVLVAGPAAAQSAKPNVAILVYDGVQIDDHAVPFEVLSQYALNNVYTVAKDGGELATWRGMRILPNHTFADAPEPDVLVLPGGDARQAEQDPEIMAWVRRTAASADHVLTICTGTFFLVETDLLDGARVTTWFERQQELARAVPAAEVVGDEIVVESGKLVTAVGSGIEGSLRVMARLHGEAWAEVVRLSMEYEIMPDVLHEPRVQLADMDMPNGIYAVFPWREAELERYEGDRDRWAMGWRFESDAPIDSLRARLARAVTEEDGWRRIDEERSDDRWTSRWSFAGHDGRAVQGTIDLLRSGDAYDLDFRVLRGATPAGGSRIDTSDTGSPRRADGS